MKPKPFRIFRAGTHTDSAGTSTTFTREQLEATVQAYNDGDWRAPPEDVGGLPGFEDFLIAMSKPRHAQHRKVVDWYGGRFEPNDIGVDTINERIAKLARRRTLGKAGFAKSRTKPH